MLRYPHQEYGTRPMYRNLFWTSPYWFMPAGAGCERTGKVRNTTGLPQVQWCCPGHGTPYSNPYHYSTGLGGLGYHESEFCEAPSRASWLMEGMAARGEFDPRCMLTAKSQVNRFGLRQVEICCPQEYLEERAARLPSIRLPEGGVTRRVHALEPKNGAEEPVDNGVQQAGIMGSFGTVALLGLLGAGLIGGGYLFYRWWQERE